MTTCPACGLVFEPEASVDGRCPQCGAPLEAFAEGAPSGVESEEPGAETSPVSLGSTEDAQPDGGAGVDASIPDPTGPASPAGPTGSASPADGPEVHPAVRPDRQPSPLRRAWMDFKASPGKLFILLKLALFQFVPGVGRLVLNGYVYTWAREQALGRHLPLPRKIVRPGVLDNGLYIYGVSVVTTIGLVVLLCILATVADALRLPIIYTVLVIVLAVCCVPFISIMEMLTALCGRVRSGLNVKRAWSLFSAPGKTGQAFAATWIPALITFVIAVVCCAIWVAAIAAYLVPFIYDVVSSSASESYRVMQVLSFIASCVPITLVLLLVLFFVSAAASSVAARALGYWAADFHPEDWPEYQENVRYYMDRAV